jgi:hypothetical protein
MKGGIKMDDTNKKWIKCALVRAIKTVLQTAIASIGTYTVLDEINWTAVLSASVLAGMLSILTSVPGLPEVGNEESNADG